MLLVALFSAPACNELAKSQAELDELVALQSQVATAFALTGVLVQRTPDSALVIFILDPPASLADRAHSEQVAVEYARFVFRRYSKAATLNRIAVARRIKDQEIIVPRASNEDFIVVPHEQVAP